MPHHVSLGLQRALATLMVVLTVTIHLLGLAGIVRVLRSHSVVLQRIRANPLTLLLAASLVRSRSTPWRSGSTPRCT